MFAPFFDLVVPSALGQSILQIGLPRPGPVEFVARAVLSLLVWAVAFRVLLRVGRSAWRRIAARVRYDERER